MEKQQDLPLTEGFQWFADPQNFNSNPNFIDTQSLSELEINILRQESSRNIQNQQFKEMQIQFLQPSQLLSDYISGRNSITCKPKQIKQVKKLSYQQNSSKQQISIKDSKDEKQNLYSKAYRERKKERYKSLEDENFYLKKKIKQLQYKLREQQIELNRFKFPPPQKQLTLDQFRRQFLERTVLVLNEHKMNPLEGTKIVYTPQDPFYHEFLDIYAQRGFAGSRKLKILEYHFNEILEAMLKDSERYMVLMFSKSKSYEDLQPLAGYESLNAAFHKVFQLDQDLTTRLKYFIKNLYPLHLELNKCCSVFYKSFQSILKCSQQIHNFIQKTYLTNMDVARKRIELETWFEFHKYGKSMRNLRLQWLQLLKQEETEEDDRRNAKGEKKKKTEKNC